ncbi:uncharacterized protein PFL1_01599 [Pseudozyma flocculosa PF-1]|uniref:EF-hand domain-containing protein n=1 Tax=Pseudozyma flocculosa TaxID=84751 RepID=A0A5C3EXL2_9BASI|nr:uncharacterized protein PFL1_01599 [Pseudozyma flocculosa PF-1]EPQ30698.1 hypothetical protein PFL1_01599 [Pseudozyma flocculosa PF-1]SPO36958.1 uncharacterized protein PSFLO_02430 [Pseudozyma flocculosa]
MPPTKAYDSPELPHADLDTRHLLEHGDQAGLPSYYYNQYGHQPPPRRGLRDLEEADAKEYSGDHLDRLRSPHRPSLPKPLRERTQTWAHRPLVPPRIRRWAAAGLLTVTLGTTFFLVGKLTVSRSARIADSAIAIGEVAQQGQSSHKTGQRPPSPVGATSSPVPASYEESIEELSTFIPPKSSPYRRKLPPIRSQLPLTDSDECLEAWLARGHLCDSLQGIYADDAVANREANGHRMTDIDVVYTWVNGSDWRHASAKRAYRKQTDAAAAAATAPAPASERDKRDGVNNDENRFRDHHELKYSMRSAAAHLRTLGDIHVSSPDYALAEGEDEARSDKSITSDLFRGEDGVLRPGQIPDWLASSSTNPFVLTGSSAERTDVAASMRAETTVHFHHDWTTFRPNWALTPEAAVQSEQRRRQQVLYKRESLPTFNSMAIEAMLGGEPNLSEHFIYSNDDFFFFDDVTTGDFYTPLYGAVFRIDPHIKVAGKSDPSFSQGEWSSLEHTNWILDQRFGKRQRPYIVHLHRSFSLPLLIESRLMFAKEIHESARMRFRDSGQNIVTQYLAYHTTIERHREALLWSFFVLRLDADGDGIVSEAEWRQAMAEMGRTDADVPTDARQGGPSQRRSDGAVKVYMPPRTTLEVGRANSNLLEAGWPVPLKTQYIFTSHDGYPLAHISDGIVPSRRRSVAHDDDSAADGAKPSTPQRRGLSSQWPDFTPTSIAAGKARHTPACVLNLDRCFVSLAKAQQGDATWVDVFKAFTFDRVQCGDCLIYQLMRASGRRGIDAFLPPRDRKVHYRRQEAWRHDEPRGVAHLPLSPFWDEAASSTASAAGESFEASCFTPACVLESSRWAPGSSARTFALHLVQRYSYVIGESPIRFEMLRKDDQASGVFADLERQSRRARAEERFTPTASAVSAGTGTSEGDGGGGDGGGDVVRGGRWLLPLVESQEKVDLGRDALVCFNDDLEDASMARVDRRMKDFFHAMWPARERWERY